MSLILGIIIEKLGILATNVYIFWHYSYLNEQCLIFHLYTIYKCSFLIFLKICLGLPFDFFGDYDIFYLTILKLRDTVNDVVVNTFTYQNSILYLMGKKYIQTVALHKNLGPKSSIF